MSNIKLPLPIPLIGGRYLLFDVEVVTYLRKEYHICGTPMGTLPQIPQQNLFLGLPIELMREEVRLLVDKNVAFVADDSKWHLENFISGGSDRKRYMESVRSLGLAVSQTQQSEQRKRSEMALAKLASVKPSESEIADKSSDENFDDKSESRSERLFDDKPAECVVATKSIIPPAPYAITPATSYISSSTTPCLYKTSPPQVPPSYALFKHLHDQNYYILPGLRFGCNYNVYPGDPLRFHSHFIAVGLVWEQDMPIFDIVGGGRLATAVKKGFLIGGLNTDPLCKDENQVRTFAIEWGGM
ncbi:hypothetical protein K3495_g2185 [Podosphaera aphanis]|nr:hypothetical protein K3495_g2185 [Podosphaera aphanis]